jgi:hypothetical protein
MMFALLWTLGPAAARELSIVNFGAEPVGPVSRGPPASSASMGRELGEGEANATRAMLNGKALYDAMRAARKGDVVVVPTGQRFVMVPYAPLYGLEHVELRLEGCLAAYEPPPGEHAKVWPFYLGNFASLITIHLSAHVTISGGGALDGRGHNWLGAAWMALQWRRGLRVLPSHQHAIAANLASTQVGRLRAEQAGFKTAHVAADRRLHGCARA